MPPTSPLPGTKFFSLALLGTCALSIGAYFLGSIPFGLLLTKLAGYGDIRKTGSGNIGATNVLRTGNKPLALLTLVLDGGKGALAAFIGTLLAIDPSLPALMGFSAVLGHVFPVWLKFKGGKGVATAVGVMLVLSWKVGLAMMVVWMSIAAIFRYSSLASLAAFIAAPVLAWFMNRPELLLPTLGFAALIYWNHRENIKRLFARTETKIGLKLQKLD
ncbi:MAG: glycerol-3-phosphate 1-O-acyltransferase PlsY [Proteobacteria bacterium]|nr:glycerol-3-phosphate 1-O-acyltransferase PlsY [Pseudomonadota bacterium]